VIMKNIIFVYFLSLFSQLCAAEISVHYKLLPGPSGLDHSYVMSFMFQENNLRGPYLIVLPNGKIANDFQIEMERKHPESKFSKRSPDDKSIYGIWDLKNAVDIEDSVGVIDGPANIREEPEGKIIGSFPDKILVRIHKEFKKWYLVSRENKDYGWTHGNNIKIIPQDQIVLRKKSPYLKNYPQKILKWVQQKKEIEYYKNLAKEKKCPANLLAEEKDGLMMTFPDADTLDHVGPEIIMHYRYAAIAACGVSGAKDAPISNLPQIKTKKCNCFSIEPFVGTSKLVMTGKQWNNFKAHLCKKRKFHYVCSEKAKHEEQPPWIYACPKSCFE